MSEQIPTLIDNVIGELTNKFKKLITNVDGATIALAAYNQYCEDELNSAGRIYDLHNDEDLKMIVSCGAKARDIATSYPISPYVSFSEHGELCPIDFRNITNRISVCSSEILYCMIRFPWAYKELYQCMVTDLISE